MEKTEATNALLNKVNSFFEDPRDKYRLVDIEWWAEHTNSGETCFECLLDGSLSFEYVTEQCLHDLEE
jgi:hypothetical protein